MYEILILSIGDMLQKEIELGIPSRAVDFMRDSIIQPAPDNMTVTLVAKEGGRGDDWAAYSGIPAQCKTYAAYAVAGIDMSDPDRVASNGDKLSQPLAEALFPRFVEAGMIYRR